MGLTDAAGGLVSGLLSGGPAGAPDLSALFKTIDTAGEHQRDLINNLPIELQQQYAAYKAANSGAANTLSSSIADNNADLMSQTKANYGPNSEAVRSAEDAAKTAIYADLPGQQAAIRQALAATGGFGRGTAAKQLAAPVLQAGQKFAQSVSNISADQLAKQQSAIQLAIEKINSVDDATANTLFGMSREQALQILQSGRQDLKDQLSSLINQSQNQTNQTLGVQGADITNKYNHDVAEKAQDDAMVKAWVNLGTNAAAAAPGFMSGLGVSPTQSAPAGYSPNMAPGQAAILGY